MFFGSDAKKDVKEPEKKQDGVAPPMPKKTEGATMQPRTKFQKPLPKQSTELPEEGHSAPSEPQGPPGADPGDSAQVQLHPEVYTAPPAEPNEQPAGTKLTFLEKMRLKKEQDALNKTQQGLNQSQDTEDAAGQQRNSSFNGSTAKVLEESADMREELPAEKPKFGFLNKNRATAPTAAPQEEQPQEPQTTSVPKKFFLPGKKPQPDPAEARSELPDESAQEIQEPVPATGIGRFFRPVPKSRTPEPPHEAEEQEQAANHEMEQELESHTPIVQRHENQPSTKFSFLHRKKQTEAEAGENLNDQTLNLSIIDRDHGENIEETLHKDDSSHHSHKSAQTYRIESRSFVPVAYIGYDSNRATVRPGTERDKARDVSADPRAERKEEAARAAGG